MKETKHDRMDPARAQALCAVLGMANAEVSTLPPFFHQVYFWDVLPAEKLGRDGHPKLGGLIPDLGLPRRMWAGGRLEFHGALRTGIEAVRVSEVIKITEKIGRTGPLTFVTLRHVISQGGQPIITEWQDLVYRQDPHPNTVRPTPPKAPVDPSGSEPVAFSPTLLFRYSGLTMNGHRIHYDEGYACEVEGYGGLVVHGPLLAQLLMLKATRELGPLAAFQFRATSALTHKEGAVLCRDGNRLWVRSDSGALCMEAAATSKSRP